MINADTGSEKHRFAKIHYEEVSVPRGEKDRSVNNLFHVQPQEMPKDMKKIVGTTQVTPWHSPSPLFTIAPLEDQAVIQWGRKLKRIDDCKDNWWCVLAGSRNIALTHSKITGGKWYLSASTFAGSACMGIPLSVKIIKQKVFYTVDTLDEYVWLPIMDPKEWSAAMVEWRSPLAYRIFSRRWPPHPLIAWQASSPGKLLMVAARQAFWNIPKTGLERLCKELDVPVSVGEELPMLILKLANHLLGHLSDDEKIVLLRLRVSDPDGAEEFLLSEEAEEFLEDCVYAVFAREADHLFLTWMICSYNVIR